MEWIFGIQRAIDYVEEHLTEEIDFEAVAKEAYSSPFHFQRVFSILCGFSLGEYIRMRRLSLAGEDLCQQGAKVIDIAFKYGYDSPESFTRAFTKFHGITPSEARKGGKLQSFTRLSVKLILTGGNTMEYRIEKADAFKVLGRRQRVNKPVSATATEDIQAFWAACGADGSLKRICRYFPQTPTFKGLLGVCFSNEMQAAKFPYAIGVEYQGCDVTDSDLEIFEVPAHTYAVFPVRGKMPESFAQTYGRIVSEFFPQSNKYEYANGIELEVYPSEDTQNPDYYCEIWIAVNEKQ